MYCVDDAGECVFSPEEQTEHEVVVIVIILLLPDNETRGGLFMAAHGGGLKPGHVRLPGGDAAWFGAKASELEEASGSRTENTHTHTELIIKTHLLSSNGLHISTVSMDT